MNKYPLPPVEKNFCTRLQTNTLSVECILWSYYGTNYIRWYLRNWCACNVQSLLFDLFKAFVQMESSHKMDFFFSMRAQHVLKYHLIQVPRSYLITLKNTERNKISFFSLQNKTHERSFLSLETAAYRELFFSLPVKAEF